MRERGLFFCWVLEVIWNQKDFHFTYNSFYTETEREESLEMKLTEARRTIFGAALHRAPGWMKRLPKWKRKRKESWFIAVNFSRLLLSYFLLLSIVLKRDSVRSSGPTMEDATSIIKSRRRPLYTIGFSIISIAQILFKRALETNGPLGTLAERIVIITSPHLSQSIHKIQFHILSILTILDDCALSISTTIESRVPLLTYFFDKMDVLVHTIETLPEKIDDVVVNVVPFVIRHIPFLKLAVTLWLKLLNLLIVHAQAIVCRLDHHNNNRTKKSSDVREEKEIRVVDTSYNDDVMVDKDGGSPLLGRSSGDDKDYGVTEETLPPLLEENGLQRKNGHDKDEDIKSTTEGSFYEDDECSVATSQEDDPIVQLFEWGWVTPNTGTFVTPTQSSSNL